MKKKKLIKIIMVLIMIFYQLSPAATVLADELEEPINNETEEIVENENNSEEELENNEENNNEEIEKPEEQEIVTGGNTLNDAFFNGIYSNEMYFENGYVFTDAKVYGDDYVPVIEDIQDELDDITLTVKDGEEGITTGEIKNNYELTFTDSDNNEATYIVVVYGDNNLDNVFDETDLESLLDDYLEGNNVPSMDIIANDDDLFGTIAFNDIAIFNDILNPHEEIIDNTDLNVSLEKDAEEIYVGDTVNFKVVINSSDLEDFIDGIEGEITNTNLELTEVKFNDSLIGTYNDEGKFVGVGAPLYNEDVIVTLVMTASEAGTGSVSISGNLAKYLDMEEFEVSGEVTILEKEETEEEEVVTEEPVVQESNPPTATPVAYYYYYSSNSNLKSLEISNFNIEFDKDVREYRITVPSNVDSLDIKALAEDYGARVEITGNENFKTGENIVLITVTAEDGSTSIYKLIVDKKAPEEGTLGEVDENSNTAEKVIIIVLIILVVLGLLYLIFKKDEEDIVPVKKDGKKVNKKEVNNKKPEPKKVNKNNNTSKQNVKKKK